MHLLYMPVLTMHSFAHMYTSAVQYFLFLHLFGKGIKYSCPLIAQDDCFWIQLVSSFSIANNVYNSKLPWMTTALFTFISRILIQYIYSLGFLIDLSFHRIRITMLVTEKGGTICLLWFLHTKKGPWVKKEIKRKKEFMFAKPLLQFAAILSSPYFDIKVDKNN